MKKDAEFESILKKLDEYPELISGKQREILRLRNDLDELSYFRNKREVFVKAAISVAVDSDGKRLYKNETEREQETIARLKADTEYIEYKEKIKLMETSKAHLEIELNNLMNRFSALKYQIRIFEILSKD